MQLNGQSTMDYFKFIIFILCHTPMVPMVCAFNSYMIVCPDTIRPGMEYTIRFNKLAGFPKARLRLVASLETSTHSNIDSSATEIPEDSDDAILILYIQPDIRVNTYRLDVKGIDVHDNTEIFQDSAYLRYVQKYQSVFIQTDKATYKPSQKVQFRAFATRSDLSILHRPMNVSIYDPNNHRIAQWLDVQDPSGVYKGSLKLSDQPPLGTWKIEVDFAGALKSQEIVVAEYVLPKFEVKVKVPSFGLTTDSYISGSVEAKYTYGKNVVGTGTLTISKSYSSYQYTTSFKINGTYRFDIEMAMIKSLFEYMTNVQLTITAEIKETLTSKTRSDTAEMTYYDWEEKVTFAESSSYFKPGLQYTAYVYLSDQADRPLGALDAQIEITVTKSVRYHTVGTETKTVNVPKNGIVSYTISNISVDIDSIRIKATVGKAYAYKTISRFESSSRDTFIQVTLKSKAPKAGKMCKFKLLSTHRRITVHYLIIAKGLIVKQGRFKMKKYSKTFRVRLTSAMLPSTKCVVYWVDKDGEIIADSVQFNVGWEFDNKVKVDYVNSRESVLRRSKPGRSLYVRVQADPGSQCNVLTVDQSVLLMKSGNDITPAKVEEEISTYDNKPMEPCSNHVCRSYSYPRQIRGQDVTEIFQNSGLLVLTDAFLYNSRQYRTSTYYHYYYYYGTMSSRSNILEFLASSSQASTQLEGEPTPKTPSVPNKSVRSFFPETWIYQSSIADSNGTALIKTTVPDTVTTWISTAFAVSKKSGLGVAMNSAELRVFMKFFVQLNLPYSVIRSEQVIIKANVFNYNDEDMTVEVTMHKSENFQAILISQSPSGSPMFTHQNVDVAHTVHVPAGAGVAVNFPIVPTGLGNIDIEVSSVSGMVGDRIKKKLLVEPEGIEEEYNIAMLIDLNEQSPLLTSRNIYLPEDVVPESVRIQLSAVGDLMGPSVTGLTKLLKMPYGCGEQNMITFVPNIFVIKYLQAVDNLNPEDFEKAKENMVAGYQRELTYQHSDGSYSAFGEYDRSGSTWLTAFVVKSFAQARPYIYIDPDNMDVSIQWLLNQFKSSGGVREPGVVLHRSMQGGSGVGDRNLATYTLISLMEAKYAGFGDSLSTLDDKIESAKGELVSAVPSMDDVFELAIASYALALSGSSVVDDVLATLDDMATTDDGTKYWTVKTSDVWSSSSQSIETTAYVLLTYSVLQRIVDGLPVMKWLVKQRNANGGFKSTQDTVIALQALSEFSALISTKNKLNMEIHASASDVEFSHTFSISTNNALLYQTVRVPESSKKLDFVATGSGMALVEIGVTYNVMADPVEPLFDIKLSYSDETLSGFKLRACFSWLGNGTSGMSVMEMKYLSGFSADKSSITQMDIIKRVEDGNKMLVLYFDEIKQYTICIDVIMERQGLVAGTQPAVVKLYDYYDPDNHAYSMYQPKLLKKTNVCDLDEDVGCDGPANTPVDIAPH